MEQRTQKKHQRILDASISLFVKYGAAKTTVDDIAKNASVSKMTLYKYFGSKSALLVCVCKHIVSLHTKRLARLIASDIPMMEKMTVCFDILTDFVCAGRRTLCAELAEVEIEAAEDYAQCLQMEQDIVLTLIRQGKEENLISAAFSDDVIYHYIDMGLCYFEHNAAYRERITHDFHFTNAFMSFLWRNVFIDPSILEIKGEIVFNQCNETPTLHACIALAKSGTSDAIDAIMNGLNADATLAATKIIDYSLSFVQTQQGLARLGFYLFNGSQMQRNYCALFFNRRGDCPLVQSAFEKGLIDQIQAFAR